jgi:hypothetical protein
MLEYQEREWEITQSLERNKKGAKIPIPAWYYDKKGVPDDLRWFWQAFWELDTCRELSDGLPRRIPWNVAVQYAEYHQINFDYLWHLIVVLDNAYVDWKIEKRKKEIDQSKKDAKVPKKGRRHVR